jgi:FPC/CPF motif-containing protein YcgG
MRDMRWASIDAYVIEAPAPKEGFDIPAAARTLNAILRWLDALNPSHDDCFDQPVDASGWRFRYLGEVLFVLVFASFYPTSHSRYAFGAEELLVVLQPDHAFSRRSDSATGLISGNLRGRIRQLYASAGRPYDLTHTLSSREAHRFLKPLANGDPPVRWWSADADAGLAC